MLRIFMDQTKNLIERSDIRIHTPELIPVDMHDNGTRTVNLHFHEYMNSASLNENFILNVLLFFGILDAFVDITHSDLAGKNFSDKNKHMPHSTDDEMVLHQTFRIYKLIRNATIHNMASISKTSDTVHIRYHFGKRDYEIIISTYGLELLNSIAIEYISPFEVRCDSYAEALRRSFYGDLLSQISLIRDEYGESFLPISAGVRLHRSRRYRPNKVSYVVKDGLIILLEKYPLDDIEISFAGVDYEINLNGDTYLIPHECLDCKLSISLREANAWRLKTVK
jgi:hypothetical protein